MALESIADLEKLHAAFAKSLNTTAAKFLKDDKPEPKVLLEEKRQLLEDLSGRLRAVTEGRTEALRTYDRQIAQIENAIKGVEVELKDDERAINRLVRAAKKPQAKRARTVRKMRSK